MIFPTKHLPLGRSLIVLGADILGMLDEPTTMSALWDRVSRKGSRGAVVGYDWFILCLVWLFTIDAIEFKEGRISWCKSDT